MTRFIMSLEEAVDLVLFAFEHGKNGDILVQKAPACTIQTQAEAVCELFGGKKEEIKVIGIRHGEKMYVSPRTHGAVSQRSGIIFANSQSPVSSGLRRRGRPHWT